MIAEPNIPMIALVASIVFGTCFFGGGYLVMGFHTWNELVFGKPNLREVKS